MSNWHLELQKRPGGGTIDVEVLKRKSWSGVAAEYVRIAAPASYDFRVAGFSNYILMHDLYRIEGDTSLSGLPQSSTKDLRNKLTFVPAGCDLSGWCRIDKCGAVEMVAVEPVADAPGAIDLSKLPPRMEFDDRMLRWALLRFRAILDDPSLDVPGYAETLKELLAFDLLRVMTGQTPPRAPTSGLNARQLQLVTEYMDGHLAERTSVGELAALLGLTRYHFIRSFKQATGVPPHQFMIRRRVDRAMELLASLNHSIAEIAVKTGFGSPVQLTRAFRRVVGTTPSAFRRARQ